MHTPEYMIFSLTRTNQDHSDKPRCWSTKDGWTAIDNATVFTEEQHNEVNLPISGIWILLPPRATVFVYKSPSLVEKGPDEPYDRLYVLSQADIQMILDAYSMSITALLVLEDSAAGPERTEFIEKMVAAHRTAIEYVIKLTGLQAQQ